MMVVAGRGELTLDGRSTRSAPMALVHVPKGTVRAVVAVDGALAYLSVHRRRSSGLQIGRNTQRALDQSRSAPRGTTTPPTEWTLSSTDTADQRAEVRLSSGTT
jgi:hypothetical protein